MPGDISLVSRWQERVLRVIGGQHNKQVDDLHVRRCGTIRNWVRKLRTSNIRPSSTEDLFDDDFADAVAIVEAHAARDAFDVDVLDDVEEFGAPAGLPPDRIELKVVGTVVQFFKRGGESEQSIECVAEKVARR